MQKIVSLAVIVCLTGLFFGCATPAEYVRSFLGVSVHSLKGQKEGRYSFYCSLKYADCYSKVLAAVKSLDAAVFIENYKSYTIGASNFNSIFPRCLDATEVGIFFEEQGSLKTKVDVVSKNYDLAKFVSNEISIRINPEVK